MIDRRTEIQEIIDRETRAWETKDVELLMSVMHPDMVWPWPPNNQTHDPLKWVIEWGRYDPVRWRKGWQALFDGHELIHNHRVTRRLELSAEADGAFAVVDVDTLWRNRETGADFHWFGRACKIYTWIGTEWKMIAQVGLLDYTNPT